jgi:hypothetical protein
MVVMTYVISDLMLFHSETDNFVVHAYSAMLSIDKNYVSFRIVHGFSALCTLVQMSVCFSNLLCIFIFILYSSFFFYLSLSLSVTFT